MDERGPSPRAKETKEQYSHGDGIKNTPLKEKSHSDTVLTRDIRVARRVGQSHKT